MGCLNAFIREFRQRLIDILWQTWDDHVNTSDRLSLYRQCKTLAGVEPYMMLHLNRYITYTLTRFRFGSQILKCIDKALKFIMWMTEMSTVPVGCG